LFSGPPTGQKNRPQQQTTHPPRIQATVAEHTVRSRISTGLFSGDPANGCLNFADFSRFDRNCASVDRKSTSDLGQYRVWRSAAELPSSAALAAVCRKMPIRHATDAAVCQPTIRRPAPNNDGTDDFVRVFRMLNFPRQL